MALNIIMPLLDETTKARVKHRFDRTIEVRKMHKDGKRENMTTSPLMQVMETLLAKEKKAESLKRRLRVRGKVTARAMTKNNNINLIVEKNKEEYKFTILKSHKERYAIAEKIRIGQCIAIDGIPKFRWIICTRLKILEKGIAEGRQEELGRFTPKTNATGGKNGSAIDI